MVTAKTPPGSFCPCLQRSFLNASGWMRTAGTFWREDQVPMTENERRAQDVLTREDVVRRILVASGMIASFLSLLLIVNP